MPLDRFYSNAVFIKEVALIENKLRLLKDWVFEIENYSPSSQKRTGQNRFTYKFCQVPF